MVQNLKNSEKNRRKIEKNSIYFYYFKFLKTNFLKLFKDITVVEFGRENCFVW